MRVYTLLTRFMLFILSARKSFSQLSSDTRSSASLFRIVKDTSASLCVFMTSESSESLSDLEKKVYLSCCASYTLSLANYVKSASREPIRCEWIVGVLLVGKERLLLKLQKFPFFYSSWFLDLFLKVSFFTLCSLLDEKSSARIEAPLETLRNLIPLPTVF